MHGIRFTNCKFTTFFSVVQLCVDYAGEKAVLLYKLQDEVMDMYHTEVPASQRGKGVGAILVQVMEGRGRDADLQIREGRVWVLY